MSMSAGASASNPLSYLQQLLQQAGPGGSKAAKAAKESDPLSMLLQSLGGDGSTAGQTNSNVPEASAAPSGSSCPPFGSDTMSALLSLQDQQSADSPSAKLFAKLDGNGDGTISKDEFMSAADKAGADSSVASAVFDKIDGDGDGAVSQSELAKADHGGPHHHRRAGGAGGGQNPLDALLSATGADGATTQTSSNADGSSTTTITYADGSKVDMTTAAKAVSDSASGGGNKSAANLIEQLIKLQSQVLSVAGSTLSALA